jgi:hypothetical protein
MQMIGNILSPGERRVFGQAGGFLVVSEQCEAAAMGAEQADQLHVSGFGFEEFCMIRTKMNAPCRFEAAGFDLVASTQGAVKGLCHGLSFP